MEKSLKNTYFVLILPAVFLIAILYLSQYLGIWEGSKELPSRFFMIVIFVLAIAVGVAIPIFLRALFFGKVKEKKFTTPEEFYKFEQKIIYLISFTPYLALIAALRGFEIFYFGGTALAAIYAMYYHYPSKKKIEFDKKVFMVKDGSN